MAASQIIHSVGRRWINQILNGLIARPANLYLGLRTLDGASGHTADAAAADTMGSNLFEASGGGYARISIAFNTTNMPESATGADSVLTFAQQTFTFTGTVTGITHAFITDQAGAGGVLIESAPLSATRNVGNGDQLKVTFQSLITQG